MTKEFLTQVGDGNVVFVDLGHKENIQVGDYFRISRPFSKKNMSLFNIDDYRKHRDSFAEVRKVIGEAVVMRVDEKTSTCLVTYSTEEITLGDDVEIGIGRTSIRLVSVFLQKRETPGFISPQTRML